MRGEIRSHRKYSYWISESISTIFFRLYDRCCGEMQKYWAGSETTPRVL